MRDGAYFIDRDPNYFRIVLNYLRSGQLIIDSSISLEAIKLEASYFGLVGLEGNLFGGVLTGRWWRRYNVLRSGRHVICIALDFLRLTNDLNAIS